MPKRYYSKYYRNWSDDLLGVADPDGFNIIEELDPAERWCWEALKALCASTHNQPRVCITPYLGFKDGHLSEIFKVHPSVWGSAKKKLIAADKIELDVMGVITIKNWRRHGGRYFIGRQYLDKEAREGTIEDEEKEKEIDKRKQAFCKEVIEYLRKKTGKDFRPSSAASYRHISARFSEGATIEDFKHVIDVKTQQWLGSPENEKYLRPQTLFNRDKFWAYKNERRQKPRQDVGSAGAHVKLYTDEELEAYEKIGRREYDQRLERAMESHGWKTRDDIDWMSIPLPEEFKEMWIRKRRAARKEEFK